MTLTAPDLPGHGKSANWDGTRDVHDATTAACAPLLGPSTDLVGHSFGATVALRLALDHPGRIRSLTLVEPVLFSAARASARAVLAETQKQAAPHIEAFRCGDTETAARLFNRIWGDGTSWKDFPRPARTYMADRIHLVDAQNAAVFEDLPGMLDPGRLEALSVPSLLIEGTCSPAVIGAINDALEHRLPNVLRVIIEGAGHMAPMTHPNAVAAAMMSLFEET